MSPAIRTLASRDLRLLLYFLHDAYAVRSLDAFARHIISRLHQNRLLLATQSPSYPEPAGRGAGGSMGYSRLATMTVVLALGLLLAPPAGEAQQSGKVHRIGYLGISPPTATTAPLWDAFLQGLRDHGYVEGQNLVIERRWSEGKAERLPDLAAELVRLNVKLIVAPSTPAARAAKQVTSTTPIVTVLAGDPVATGLVQSLDRPGGT